MKIVSIIIYQAIVYRAFIIERSDTYFSDPRQRAYNNSGNLTDKALILRISKLL